MTTILPTRVLIIDDEPNDCLLIRTSLKRKFPTLVVETVSTRTDFQSAKTRGPFDVVITDHDLTWSDGIQIMQEVRGLWADCQVLMYTGAGSEQLAVKAMKAGLTDYIVKSTADLHELLASIARVIESPHRRKDSEVVPANLGGLGQGENVQVRLNEILDQMPIGAALVQTESWSLTHVNPVLAEWYGIQSGAQTDLKLDQFHPRGHLHTLLSALRNTKQSREERAEVQTRTLLGKELPLVANMRPMPGSQDGQVLMFYEDVSELRTQERRLRALADSLPPVVNNPTFWQDLCHSGRTSTEADLFFVAALQRDGSTVFSLLAASTSSDFPGLDPILPPDGPWQELSRRKLVCVAQGLQKDFKHSDYIVQSGAESFVGVPIHSETRSVIGCIGLLSRQPWKKLKLTKALLQVYSTMSAARFSVDATSQALSS